MRNQNLLIGLIMFIVPFIGMSTVMAFDTTAFTQPPFEVSLEAEPAGNHIDELPEAVQDQLQELVNKHDWESMKMRVKHQVDTEILKMDFRKQMQKEMDIMVKEIVVKQKFMEERMKLLKEHELDQYERFKDLLVKNQLKGLMDKIQQDGGIYELLTKNKIDPNLLKDDPTVKVNFNMRTGAIHVKSNQKTTNGLHPLFEWIMFPKRGEIEEIVRDITGEHEKVTIINIDPKTLKTEEEGLGHILKELKIVKKEIKQEQKHEQAQSVSTATPVVNKPYFQEIIPSSDKATKESKEQKSAQLNTKTKVVLGIQTPLVKQEQQSSESENANKVWWAYPVLFLIIFLFFGQCGFLYVYLQDPQNDKTNIASQIGIQTHVQPKVSTYKKKQTQVTKNVICQFFDHHTDGETYNVDSGSWSNTSQVSFLRDENDRFNI